MKLPLKQPGILLSRLAALFLLVFPDLSLASRHPATGTSVQCETISIVAPDNLLKSSSVRMAVQDTIALLHRGFPKAKVTLNAQVSGVRIVLPDSEQLRTDSFPHPKPHARYPVETIARQRESMTAYRFGYLYPASSLFFWKREEEQIRQGRFDPFFMNLWDFRRVLGMGSLF